MKSFRYGKPPRNDAPAGRVIRLFQSETAEIVDAPEPTGIRLTIFVLGACVLTLFVLAAVTRIDRVVSSISGEIVTTQPTIVLQALDPSIIKTLNVREGQRVKAGDVLATLDPTFATADVDALKLQIASLDAEIARCDAELAQKPYDPAPSADPSIERYAQIQRAYYGERKAQFDDQVRAYDAQMAQYNATIAKLQNDAAIYSDRGKLAKQVEQMRATLAAAQVGSRLNLLQAADQKMELLRQSEYDKHALVEAQHQLQATTDTRAAFVQQWLGDASKELVNARNQRDGALQKLDKAMKHKDLVRLVATEDAVVLKMAKLSVGSVLKEGQPLVYLAPLHSPVEAEVHIRPRDVGFLRPGDPVKLKLDAYDFIAHGMVDGRVRWISEGSFATDENTGRPTRHPYYKVRIGLTRVHLDGVPDSFRLIPGMTLTADVHIGTRSILMYMINGAIRGANEAMREP